MVIEKLHTVYDPEIPADVWELGLVYDIRIDEQNNVDIEMTMTTPNCPEAQSIPMRTQWAVEEIPGIGSVNVQLVWDPPWNPDMMSEVAKVQLGYIF